MSLTIRAVREKGILEKERIVLYAESNEDIGQYILFSTEYREDNTVSSDIRQTLWLPDYKVGAGDLIVIYTKKSSQITKEKTNNDGTKTVFVYWGLDKTIWNHGNDSAVLIKIDNWDWKKV